MARQKRRTRRENPLKKALKKRGLRMPHGYKVIARKKRKSRKKR